MPPKDNSLEKLIVKITKIFPENQMFTRFFLLVLGFTILTPLTFSQHKEMIKKAASVAHQIKGDVEPNIVVFKLKKQFRNLEIQGKLPSVNARLEKHKIKIKSLQAMFPGVRPPEKEKNDLGQTLVDLSLIYRLEYEGDLDLSSVIDLISKSGLVEYAEPLFRDKILAIPNDPLAQSGGNMEFYLKNMKAYEAFEVEDGDTNVVIGIIDTGVKYEHEDLVDNIKYNYADPIDGIDNDNDGYLDNFRGWDLGGNDNNPYSATGNEHGTVVAGIAGAKTNNGVGMIGAGNKCKILPLKGSFDSPGSSIIQGYPAVKYGADHNCKVLNLSWGGAGGYSQASQDMINYAAINKDVVIIAAAGNDDLDNVYYPASYDHVLSVAALDTMYHAVLDSFIEKKASFGTYNYNVDIGAQGRRLVSTTYAGYVSNNGGSSFAAPIVAGAAGLVRAKYPTLNALQVAELLRVTADPLLDTVAQNIPYKEKLGKGRLNMYRALTDNVLPAVRMTSKSVYNGYGSFAASGDTVELVCNFRNYLQPTSNANVVLSTTNPNIVVIDGTQNLGSIPTLGNFNNESDPFTFYVKPEAGLSEKIMFRLGYEDAALNYTDYQYFEIAVNPPFLDIDTNQIALSVTTNGRFGYSDDQSTIGNGLVYKGESILYEAGLMISSGNTKVSDCVRGSVAGGSADVDFSKLKITNFVDSPEADEETSSLITDTTSSNPVKVVVNQRTYAHENAPDDKYIIVEYDITNVSGSTIDSLRAGIFADWDIMSANQNKANWNTQDSIGYTYYTGANGIYAGVCLLTKHIPSCYSLDHGTTGGNNINPNDGFTTLEKYNTLSKGIARPQAGGTGLGFDVSQVVGGTLTNFLPNEKRTIAFAFVVGDDVLDLKANARRAKDYFRSFNTSPVPVVTNAEHCKYDTLNVTVAPSNGTKFNFYNAPTDVTPIQTGSTYTINNAYETKSVYIRGIDSLFESSTVKADINFHNELTADFSFAPDTVDLDVSPYVFLIDNSNNANQISWDLGDGNTVNNDPGFLHEYTSPGNYKVLLTALGDYGCEDTISHTIVVIAGTTSINSPWLQSGVTIYPNPASDILNIEFAFPSAQNIQLNVFNTLGEEVYGTQEDGLVSRSYKLDLSDYTKGIYYAKIMVGRQSITRTFVVQ